MIPNDSDFESEVSLEMESSAAIEDMPFHILLLGDWSGSAQKSDISQRRPIVIDRDNFDEVMRKFDVTLDLDLYADGRSLLPLHFAELNDFHPDRIFEQVPIFADLRDIRRRLLKSESFNEAAKEVSSWFKSGGEEANVQEKPQETPSVINSNIESGNLLDQILSKPIDNDKPVPGASRDSELNALLGKLVKPYLVEIDENEQSKLLGAVDEVTSILMRSILHNNQFQSLESAWLGLYFLVRKVDTDVDLKIYLLDVSQEEIARNLKDVGNLADSQLYQWIIQDTVKTPGGEPWALISGIYNFGVNVDDIATLIRLGKLASDAKAPFISHIRPEVLGVSSLAENPNPESWNRSPETNQSKLWATLRSLPEASYLGLVIPRFMARLPYGRQTEPIESFSFDEFTATPGHDDYLWANPSFLSVLLLAQSFRSNGWEMNQLSQDIEGLPIHIYQENGETITKPSTEVVFTVNACEEILEQGLMPLISFKNSDRVRLARFQSIAHPAASLQGRWSY